jgi:hypothetical protein
MFVNTAVSSEVRGVPDFLQVRHPWPRFRFPGGMCWAAVGVDLVDAGDRRDDPALVDDGRFWDVGS